MFARLQRQVRSAILETPLEQHVRSAWRIITRTPRLSPDIEKSHYYDFLTRCLLKEVLKPDSNCVDVGAHRGAILGTMIKYAPKGRHLAIEPIAECAAFLEREFPQATVHQVALSDKTGSAPFQIFSDRFAYSGLRVQPHVGETPITEVTVSTETLDHLVGDLPIDVVKIDVEGGEYHVIAGGRNVLGKHHPLVVFEHGAAASGVYGVTSKDLFLIFAELEYQIALLSNWRNGRPPLSMEEFVTTGEWMFVAYPRSH